MWNLRGHPHGQLATSTVIGGQDPTWLHGHRHEALLRDLQTHDLISLAEPVVGHAYRFSGRLMRWTEDAKHDVVIEFIVHSGRTGLGRLLRVDHGGQNLHLHFDEIDCILGYIGVVGDHHRYRLTDKPHFAHCQSVVHRHLHAWSSRTARNGPYLAEQVGSGQYRHHARVVFRRLDIEALDTGMGIWTAKEGGMQRAHRGDIIDVPPQPLNECRVFATFDAIAYQFRKHGGHGPLSSDVALCLLAGTGADWRLKRHTA